MPAIAPALRVVAAFASTASVEVGVGLEEEVVLEGRFAVVVEEVAEEEVCEVVLVVIEVELVEVELGTLFTVEGAELVASDVEAIVDEGVDFDARGRRRRRRRRRTRNGRCGSPW
jgi:hypothetical protein